MIAISINPDIWNLVSGHLLQTSSEKEQPAFLFGRYEPDQSAIRIIDQQLMTDDDFVSQRNDYLELRDPTRAHLIKRAHTQHACLIEIHSHPGALRAAFSSFGLHGLEETVRHMQWRLHGQPYVAIVVAGDTYDALVWNIAAREPCALHAINVGPRTLSPTNLSLGRWKGIKNESV
jgi:hypothetical protein